MATNDEMDALMQSASRNARGGGQYVEDWNDPASTMYKQRHGGSFVTGIIDGLSNAVGGLVNTTGKVMRGEQDYLDPKTVDSAADFAVNGLGPGAVNAAVSAPLKAGETQLGTFAGKMSRTADYDKLARAQVMEEKGAGRNDIWDASGWFRGKDGMWRYEISDKGAHIKSDHDVVQAGRRVRDRTSTEETFDHVGSAVHHPELLKAYPDLEKFVLKGTQEPKHGYYSASREQIAIPRSYIGADGFSMNSRDRMKVFLHEAQHHAQAEEGFVRGNNPANIDSQLQQSLLEKMEQRVLSRDEALRYSKLIDDYQKLPGDKQNYIKYQLYQRDLGEAEARLTEHRRHLTDEQRRAQRPWEHFDYDEPDLIVPFDHGR